MEQMAQAAKAQEPSMEEILASIRRIIADDETKPAANAADPAGPVAAAPTPSATPSAVASPLPPPADAAEPPSSETDSVIADPESPPPDVLELTEDMTAMPASAFRTIDGQSDVVFTEPPPPEPEGQQPSPQDDRLLSGSTSVAVDSAFSSLAQTVLLRNARTLEDVVREMLRPMLKTWLDDNLPGLVERLVRAEIERVSRGRS
jgi:cell pole-organizing protein PopZ